MKQPFRLSKSNMIYFGVIAVLFIVLFVAFSDRSPYQAAEFAGRLSGSLLGPSLVAWIVWRLSGRKEKRASLAFNIFLTLILLGQIGQLGSKDQPHQELSELHQQKEELKEEISKADDPAEIETAISKYRDSVKVGINRLSETSTGMEKQFYRILSDFVTETQATSQDWKESFYAVQSPRILDYSLLNSDEEFDYQRNTLRVYVENTRVYSELLANMVPNLEKRLRVLGDGNAIARRAVQRATKEYLSKKNPIVETLMQAHAGYGRTMIQILELLQKNKDEWTYENDELLIYDENVLTEYNELIVKLGDNEATINALSEKFVEEM